LEILEGAAVAEIGWHLRKGNPFAKVKRATLGRVMDSVEGHGFCGSSA